MGTSFEKPIQAFLNMMERDVELFEYLGVSDARAREIVYERARSCLIEAADTLVMNGVTVFEGRDESLDMFDEVLTPSEANVLLPNFMKEMFLRRDIAYIRLREANYTGTELRVLDPSNLRNSWRLLYNVVVEQNRLLLDTYNNRDRETHGFVGVDYGSMTVDSE